MTCPWCSKDVYPSVITESFLLHKFFNDDELRIKIRKVYRCSSCARLFYTEHTEDIRKEIT
jgi:hypothetical protein